MKLTDIQRRVLQNLAEGRPHGATVSATLIVLKREDLIAWDGQGTLVITESGKEAIS